MAALSKKTVELPALTMLPSMKAGTTTPGFCSGSSTRSMACNRPLPARVSAATRAASLTIRPASPSLMSSAPTRSMAARSALPQAPSTTCSSNSSVSIAGLSCNHASAKPGSSAKASSTGANSVMGFSAASMSPSPTALASICKVENCPSAAIRSARLLSAERTVASEEASTAIRKRRLQRCFMFPPPLRQTRALRQMYRLNSPRLFKGKLQDLLLNITWHVRGLRSCAWLHYNGRVQEPGTR